MQNVGVSPNLKKSYKKSNTGTVPINSVLMWGEQRESGESWKLSSQVAWCTLQEKRKVTLFETSQKAETDTWGCPNWHTSAVYHMNVPIATPECMRMCTHRENLNSCFRSDTAFKVSRGCFPKSYLPDTTFQSELQCKYKQANRTASSRRQG